MDCTIRTMRSDEIEIAMPDAAGLGWLKQGRVAGWGLIRRCREGHKIGPLVADDPSIASALFAALCARVPVGDTVYLDVPMPNGDALTLALRLPANSNGSTGSRPLNSGRTRSSRSWTTEIAGCCHAREVPACPCSNRAWSRSN